MQTEFSLEEFKKRLQNGQYKLTNQRKVILDVFVNNPGRHLSADDVYAILKETADDIGLATIYRTLELMCGENIGILKKMDFDEGCYRYELDLAAPNMHQHHHMICQNCKKVIEFSDDMLEALENKIFECSGFKVLDHQVKFFGLCKECQN